MSTALNIIEIWDKEMYENAINDSNVDFAKLTEEVMGNDEIMFHKPVMLSEAIDSLEIKENGIYVDLTLEEEAIQRNFKKNK